MNRFLLGEIVNMTNRVQSDEESIMDLFKADHQHETEERVVEDEWQVQEQESEETAIRRRVAELVLERTQLRRRVIEQSETIASLRRSLTIQSALALNAASPSPLRSPEKSMAANTSIGSPGGVLAMAGSSLPSSPNKGRIATLRRVSSDLSHQTLPSEAAMVTAKWNMELLDLVELLQAANTENDSKHAAKVAEMEAALEAERRTNDELRNEAHGLKARLADEVLQRTRLHRLEQAAARLTGPRRLREGGLSRLEAAERNTMAVHDDLYYVQRCDGLSAPVRSISMAFLCFTDLDSVQDQSPELVPFVVKSFLSAAQKAAECWGGYRMTQHKVFTAYAFRSPASALNFAADVHTMLLGVAWPDSVTYIKSCREICEGKDVVYCGPRVYSTVYHGNPITEVNAMFGNIEYCGKDTMTAVQMLTQMARPGEILCNAAWMAEYLAEQHAFQPPPQMPAGGDGAVPAVAVVPKEVRGYDMEERQIDMGQPSMSSGSLNAQAATGAAQTFVSLLPLALKKRRRLLANGFDEKAVSDAAIATIALAVKTSNGRLHGVVPEEIRRWQAKREQQQSQKKRTMATLSKVTSKGHLLAGGGHLGASSLFHHVSHSTTSLDGSGGGLDVGGEIRNSAITPEPSSAVQRNQRGSNGASGGVSSISIQSPTSQSPSTVALVSPSHVQQQQPAQPLQQQTATPRHVSFRQFQLNKIGQKAAEAMERLLMEKEDSQPGSIKRLPKVGDTVAACCVDLVNAKKLRKVQVSSAVEGGENSASVPQAAGISNNTSVTFSSPLSPLTSPTSTQISPGGSSAAGVFTFDETMSQLRQVVSSACHTFHGTVIACSSDDVAVVVFPNALLAFRFASYVQVQSQADIRCIASLPAKELLPDEPMVRCGIAFGPVVAPLSAPPHVVSRANKFLKLAARVCSVAQGGEILVVGEAVRSFRSSVQQLVSTEFAIVGRGMKILSQFANTATEIFSLQPSALAFRHKILLANTQAVTASANVGGGVGASSMASQSGGASTQQQSGAPPSTATQPAAAAPPPSKGAMSTIAMIQVLEGRELKKIMSVFTTPERQASVEHGSVPATVIRAAQTRLEKLETDLMRVHDLAGVPVMPPTTMSEEPLAILYCDVESSAKLLEACGEHFVRSQQHFCRIALDLFAAYDGYVVKNNSLEAMLVVFRSPRSALDAAVELQLQLLSSEWPAELSRCERALRVRDAKTQNIIYNGLRVRIGIALGRLQSSFLSHSKRVDYFGPVIAQAVRIGRSAPGGEIWVAPDVAEAVAAASRRMGLLSPLEGCIMKSVQDVGSRAGELLAFSCFPPQTAARATMKTLPDRRERIFNASDANAWWRSASSCTNKLTAVKYAPSSNKKKTNAAGNGQTVGGTSGGSIGLLDARTCALVSSVNIVTQRLESVASKFSSGSVSSLMLQASPVKGGHVPIGSSRPSASDRSHAAPASGASPVFHPDFSAVLHSAIDVLNASVMQLRNPAVSDSAAQPGPLDASFAAFDLACGFQHQQPQSPSVSDLFVPAGSAALMPSRPSSKQPASRKGGVGSGRPPATSPTRRPR